MKKLIEIISPCPVLNIPDFQSVFGGSNSKLLKIDKKGFLRNLEFIALKNMIFEIEQDLSKIYPNILKVSSEIYQNISIYLDKRFTQKIIKPKKLTYNLNPHNILKKLNALEKTKYVWGGNYSNGITSMLKFYPYLGSNKNIKELWIMKGVDCSGVLFEVTDIHLEIQNNFYIGKNRLILKIKQSMKSYHL